MTERNRSWLRSGPGRNALRRMRWFLVPLVGLLGALVLSPTAAHAAGPYNGQCETSTYYGEFCLYDGYSYNVSSGIYDTLIHKANYAGTNYVNRNFTIDNSATSAQNFDPYQRVKAYQDANYGGYYVLFYAKYEPCNPDVCWQYVGLYLNDQLSSHLWV